MKKKMVPKARTSGTGGSKISHKPHVATHKAGPKAPKGKKASLHANSMVSSNFKKNIPVKGAHGKGKGKKGDSGQENPFGKGEVIKFGFS